MNQTPSNSSANSEFNFDPTNKVVGIIDDAGDALAAFGDLRTAGFTTDEIEVLTDEEGAEGLDLRGEGREVALHVLPATQERERFYDAPGLVRQIRQKLGAGHCGIAVRVGDAMRRERVREILKSRGGHFINFYGEWAVESLEP